MTVIPDAYFAGVRARHANIPKNKNPYNDSRPGRIDVDWTDKIRTEWDRGWDAEDKHLSNTHRI